MGGNFSFWVWVTDQVFKYLVKCVIILLILLGCEIVASNIFFDDDTCGKVFKYLKVCYECMPDEANAVDVLLDKRKRRKRKRGTGILTYVVKLLHYHSIGKLIFRILTVLRENLKIDLFCFVVESERGIQDGRRKRSVWEEEHLKESLWKHIPHQAAHIVKH